MRTMTDRETQELTSKIGELLHKNIPELSDGSAGYSLFIHTKNRALLVGNVTKEFAFPQLVPLIKQWANDTDIGEVN